MHIIEFFQKMNKRGETVDWVKYSPSLAEMSSSVSVCPVHHLKPKDFQNEMRAPGDQVLHHWEQFFGPAYEAWLAGNEMPEHGTPIAAWAALDRAQVQAMRNAGVKTIEDLAGANEDVLRKIKVPNVRGLKSQAEKFLEVREIGVAVAEMSDKDDEIEALKAQIAEIQASLPKRGRPRKEPA